MSSSALANAKADLRARIHQSRLRASQDPTSWRSKNTQLSMHITNYVHAQRSNRQSLRIAAYVPLADEPGAEVLLEALAEITDELWLPICRPGFQLNWALYDGPDSLHVPNPRLPVAEPIADGIPSKQCLPNLDLVVVPALAIDHNGFRLGKGAGFYDRALAAARRQVTGANPSAPTTMPELLGVVFAAEIFSQVPHDHHDCSMDKVVTEYGIRSLNRTSAV